MIKLQLFPFSLRDVTTTWFESLPYKSMNNWEELVEAYMSRFFPLALTSKRREDERLLCSSKEKMKAFTMPGKIQKFAEEMPNAWH